MPNSALINVQVYCISERIDLKEARRFTQDFPVKRFGRDALSLAIAADQIIFLFRFGAVAFVNIPEAEHEKLFSDLGLDKVDKSLLEDDDFIEDDCIIEISDEGPKIRFNRILIPAWNEEYLYIVARVVAQSCRLDLLEQDVEEVLNESSTLVNRIESPRWVGSRRKHLVAQLGSILRLRHDMVTRLLLLHTPDSTWDQEVCSKLHHSLHSDYEIDIRRQNIDRMLSLSSETINAELHLLDTRRSELLEIIIILLIAFEIVPVLLP